MALVKNAASNVSAYAHSEQSGDPTAVALRWLTYFKSDGLYYRQPSGSGGAALRLLTAADLSGLGGTYQPLDADLTAIAALSTLGFLRRTASNTWSLVNTADFSVPAAGMYPSTTNGPAQTKIESATNKQNYYVLEFDQSTIEYAEFMWTPPDNWDAGTITFAAAWTAAAGSGNVIWTLQGRAYANDDAIDQAWGTGIDVTDTLTAIGDLDIAPTSAAVTIGGMPAAGNPVFFRISRKASDGSDTLNADARLLSVRLFYGIA